MRLLNLGLGSAALQVAVVVAYEDDAVDTVDLNSTDNSASHRGGNDSSDTLATPVLWQLVTHALAHGNGGGSGVHLVLVTNGFGLGDDVRAALIAKCGRNISNNDEKSSHSNRSTSELDHEACGSIAVVELSEVVGFGAAVNMAMEHLHAPDTGLLQRARHYRSESHVKSSNKKDQRNDDGNPKLHASGDSTHFRSAIVAVTSAASPLRSRMETECPNRRSQVSSSSPNPELNGHLGDTNAAAGGCDLWHAYASLVLTRGGSQVTPPLVFAGPPSPRPRVEVLHDDIKGGSYSSDATVAVEAWAQTSCVACIAPMPLLVFDAALWRTPSASVSSPGAHGMGRGGERDQNRRESFDGSGNKCSREACLGPLDDGFWLQGAVGEWAYRAQRRGLFVDASSPARKESSVDTHMPLAFDARFLSPLTTRHRNLIPKNAKTQSSNNIGIASRASGRSNSIGDKKAHEPQSVGPFSMPGTALLAAESLAALDVDHLLVHLQV